MQFAELFPDVTLATRRADITGSRDLMEEREKEGERVRSRLSRSDRNAKPLI